MAINKSSWYELGHFVTIPIILIQIGLIFEILERKVVYGENFTLLCYVFLKSMDSYPNR